MSSLRAWLSAFWLISVAGCSHATADGRSACTSEADCPPEFPVCRADLRCWRSPETVDSGAGVTDAGVVSEADAERPDAALGMTDAADAFLDGLDASSPIDALGMMDAWVPDAFSEPDAPATHDAGRADAGAMCSTRLPDVGSGDFFIELDVRLSPSHTGTHALASQRSICNTGSFWELRVTGAGVLEWSMDDFGANTLELTGCRPVQDDLDHHVIVQRVAGVVSAFVDGRPDFTNDGSIVTSLGALPPIRVGTSICSTSGVADFPTGGTDRLSLGCILTDFEPMTGSGFCP